MSREGMTWGDMRKNESYQILFVILVSLQIMERAFDVVVCQKVEQ